MKRIYKYIIGITCSLAAVFACTRFEEQDVMDGDIQKVKMVFDAVAEGPADTKAVLDGQLGDALRQIVWEPGDMVGMTESSWSSQLTNFTNVETEASNHASFEGEADYSWSYVYAFYPYAEDVSFNSGTGFKFTLPSEQQYYPGSFAHGAMPMVAKGNYGEILKFKALCGAIALNIVGEGTVKSVTFMATDESGTPVHIAGRYSVGMSYESVPEINSYPEVDYSNMSTSLTLNCGDGVTLDPSTPTPFYIVVPVGTYSSFRVVIAMTDGRMMFKEGKNPLTIKRANITKTGSLPFVEVETVDVSLTGRSNCYQITDAGIYSFDATVMGNGEFGLVENVDFHTKNPTISPVTAEVIWQDRTGVISGVACDGERISFIANGTKGNALIAAKDDNGKILWSWHIWVTEQPEDQIYINDRGSFTMQDRNLGAIRAERGSDENWRQSVGNFYQWGRKDPFNENVGYEEISSQVTVAESILYPTTFISIWGNWSKEQCDTLWSGNQKTIYDPCPVGYRVPVKDVWYGFTADGSYADRVSSMNVSGQYNYGWNFKYDGANDTWYPTTDGSYGRYFSATRENVLQFYYYTDLDCFVNPFDTPDYYAKYNVRCMKDEGHVDTSYPTVKIKSISEVTSTSATLVANVTDEGISEIIERGVIWGLSEDITLENADNATSDPGKGEYTMKIDGLSHSTRYYIKAYAINEKGVSYSKAKSFYTPYEGNAVDLSRNGTANCYIVPVAYSDYVFDASVKGNSKESVGAIASVEVLWETINTGHTIPDVGSVIESVELEGNNVKFRLPFDCKPGNALIAVKDANGTILWSWHIWIVDFDPFRSGQVYIGGNMMMDRNLGALSVVPSNDGMDYSAYGLYYQWGRKDPSPLHGGVAPSNTIIWYTSTNGYNSLEASISNPNVFVADIDWNTSDKWSEFKTMYDPCPVGWRVPQSSAWDNITENVLTTVNNIYKIIPEPYSVPAAYYPLGGEYISVWPGFNNFNSYAYWWYTDYVGGTVRMSQYDSFCMTSNNSSYGLSVRCMKDADFVVNTGVATNVTGTSIDMSGSVTVNDNTVLDSVGFIYREAHAYATSLKLNGDYVQKAECSVSEGDFSKTLSELKPNTQYEIRAYASGGYNVRYGDIIYISTVFDGSSEDVGNGGNYEWE